MNERITRLLAELAEPLLVSSPVNVRYLTGFSSSNAALLVEPDGVRIFTDFRYAEQARALPAVELVETRRNLYSDLATMLSGRIGFEPEALTVDRYETLAAGGIELVPRRRAVEALRTVKNSAELDSIQGAARVTSEAFARLAGERFTGRTEHELAWRMGELLHELGGDGLAFPVIVAAGPNGALPHAVPGDRPIEPGELVIVDAGCRIDGYCSDCTRTFATGALPSELEAAYEVVRQAQEAGLAGVVAGADGAEVDRLARDLISQAGLGERFGHGLGHGVGLEVHEAPWLNPEFPSTLAAGNVVTVEPGVYLPGRGGVRIEDLVIVGAGSAEVLTTFTKELSTVI